MNTDWIALMGELGRDFATRAPEHDANDSFVNENYARLRECNAFAAGVPAELGGGGASHEVLCCMIRELSRHCGSTGLAFSMHTHLVGTLAYLWRSGNKAPEPMLRRVAAEKLILISSGGSDWLPGSGKLERVDGGFRFTARKIFSSGVPAGDILMTTGVYDDPQDGSMVYHFPLPLKSEGVKILDTWRTIGMRGTGSHDVEIKDVFLPDAVMQGVRRPAGKWHPFMHTVVLAAFPILYGAYLGVVEAVREIALSIAARKKEDPLVPLLLGEMENQIVSAQIAHASMVALTATQKPGAEATNAMACRRTIFVNAVTRAAEKAMEVGGGTSFYRSTGLERCFRDIQGARYHPIQEKAQTRFTGRLLLGLDLDG
jgi:alkylation response protein AidB-like acyl-CoA dehydrogenase